MPDASPEHSDFMLQDSLLDLFLYLGTGWVLWLLMALSVLSIAVTLERLVHFARNRVDTGSLANDLSKVTSSAERASLSERLSQAPTHTALIIAAGLDAFARGPSAAEQAMASATLRERLRMERGLAFLGTLGNNAPYIGLFGTVLGIIRAFRDLAANSIEGSEAVMSGIAEALVATAVGLLVALPAVALFNAFQRRIRATLVGADSLSRLLLSQAKSKDS